MDAAAVVELVVSAAEVVDEDVSSTEVEVVPAAVVDVDAAAVVELVVSAAVVVDEDVSSSEVEVASSEVEVASSVEVVPAAVVDVDAAAVVELVVSAAVVVELVESTGVPDVVVAGGPSVLAEVVLGWLDSVVSTSVGAV